MKPGIFTGVGFVLALTFWILESFIHFLIFEEQQYEWIPSELNELWMRIVIVLLIFLYGVIADFFLDKIQKKQIEVANTYHEMISASRHILTNLVNQMHLFKLEAIKSKDFNQDIIEYYDNSIIEASSLVETLSRVEDLTELAK